jgi:hypothetical protein
MPLMAAMIGFDGVDLTDVGSSHEGHLAGASDDDHFDGFIFQGHVDGRVQVLHRLCVKGIHRWVIQSDDGHPVFDCVLGILQFSHWFAPFYESANRQISGLANPADLRSLISKRLSRILVEALASFLAQMAGADFELEQTRGVEA